MDDHGTVVALRTQQRSEEPSGGSRYLSLVSKRYPPSSNRRIPTRRIFVCNVCYAGSIAGNVYDDCVVYVLPYTYSYQYLEIILLRRSHGSEATVIVLLLLAAVQPGHNRLFHGMKSKVARKAWQVPRCKTMDLVIPQSHWPNRHETDKKRKIFNVSASCRPPTMLPKTL